MRINDSNRSDLYLNSRLKRPASSEKRDEKTIDSAYDNTRSKRVEQLKAAFQSGKPVDLNRLADRLLQSGVFDEKA